MPLAIGFILVLVFSGCGVHPMESQVRAVLDEAAVPYELKGCQGGWIAREMYCEVEIKPDHVEKFKGILGMKGKEVEYSKYVKSELLSKLKSRHGNISGEVFWHPSKHGFHRAVLFYDQSFGRAYLYLGIAYG